MKIILTGSVGHITKPLAEQLIREGHQITIVSSNAIRTRDIEGLGACAAIGSVSDSAFLSEILAGADALYAMIPPNFAAPDFRTYYQEIGNSYAKAVQATGVKRLVHLSSWGAHLKEGTGYIIGSNNVETILNELTGVNITHLRPGYFFYNLYNFTDMIKDTGIIGANYGGEDKIAFVSTKDIAMVAANELTTEGSGKVRYIASEDITANAAAQIIGKAIGKTDLKWVTFSDDQALAASKEAGVPSLVAELFVELGAAIHSGVIREDYDLHKPAKGATKLQDFAREFAAAYNQ